MFPAFLDTCTLYGAYLCDSLLRLAEAGTYRPLWSAGVLDELERNLVERGLAKESMGLGGAGFPRNLGGGAAAGGHGPALLATGVLPVRRPAP